MGTIPVLSLVVWLSLIPPLPALLVSGLDHGVPSLWHAVLGASWTSILAVVYLGAVATVLAYAIWGYLLARYPAASVAPFTLLAPCTGAIAAALIFGERYSAMRYAGMALILGGWASLSYP